MQNCKIYKQFVIGLLCSLMVIITTIAIADSPVSPYSLHQTAERGNPWALPQIPNNDSGVQQMPEFWGQQYQGRQQQYNQHSRFVTPEILESLKQQQTQNQLTPENKQSPKPQQSIRNYSSPSLGMGLTNLLYDTHSITME